MIDPNIILQSKTPTEQAQGAANVAETNQRTANLATLGQVQQGQLAMQPGDLQAQGLENQQRQQAITDDQNFRQLYQKTVVNGQPLTDSQVLSTLGPTHGAAFLTAQLASRKTRADIQKLNDEGQTADADYAGGLATMVAKAGDSPDAVNRAIATAHHDGHEDVAQQLFQLQQTNPQAIPGIVQGIISRSPKWSTEARLDQAQKEQAARDAQIAAHNQVTESQAADTAQRNTDRDVETNRHNTVMEGLGQQRTDIYGDREDRLANSAGGKARTAEANAAAKEEQKQDGLRQTLGNALVDKNTYVDATGKTVSFQKFIPRLPNEEMDAYQTRIAPQVKTLMQQMQNRYTAATQAANAATARKNNAIIQAGGTPDTTTEQAIAARGGQASPPQQPPASAQAQPAQPARPAQPAAAPRSPLPQGGGKPLDRATAAQFLAAAGGDKVKARQLAQQSNWKF